MYRLEIFYHGGGVFHATFDTIQGASRAATTIVTCPLENLPIKSININEI